MYDFPGEALHPSPTVLLCPRDGHIAAVCKGTQRCPKCREDHRGEDCKDDVQDTCCICGGATHGDM